MSAPARASLPSTPSASLEMDHERRFQPSRGAVEAFLRGIRSWTEPCVYDAEQPHAFTRTTYFDTAELEFLGSCRTGSSHRLRLREYAGTADLSQPPVLSGLRFLEVKRSTGERRTKLRYPLQEDEADALLSGTFASRESTMGTLLRPFTRTPVIPWVTAWYRRTTHRALDGCARITFDEDLIFSLPPSQSAAGSPATPSWVLSSSPASLLEVKWRGRAPSWLEWQLRMLSPFEVRGSKFEQGMQARLAAAPLVQ